MKNNFIDLERIKIDGKTGGSLEDTMLVNGVVLEQQFSHPHMEKVSTTVLPGREKFFIF